MRNTRKAYQVLTGNQLAYLFDLVLKSGIRPVLGGSGERPCFKGRVYQEEGRQFAVTTFGVHAFVYVPVPAQGKGFSPEKTRRGKGSDVAGKDGEHSLVVAELKIFHVHWNELGPGRRSAAGKGNRNRPVPKDILSPLRMFCM